MSNKALNYVLVGIEGGDNPILRDRKANEQLWGLLPVKAELDILMHSGDVVKTYAVTKDAISILEWQSSRFAKALKIVHVYALMRDNRNVVANIQRPDLGEKLIVEET